MIRMNSSTSVSERGSNYMEDSRPRRAPWVAALLLVGLSVGLLLVPGQSSAQQGLDEAFMVVDAQRIIRESDAIKRLQRAIDGRRQVLQQELIKRQEQLRAEEQSLIERRDSLSEEAFAVERRSFQQKIAELQREVQNQRSTLDRLYASGFSDVQEALERVVASIAEERGAAIVVTKNSVIYNQPELDATEEALQRLNAAFPEVNLPFDLQDPSVSSPNGGAPADDATGGAASGG